MFDSLRYTIKQAFKQVFRNRTMSLASVFSITAMLLILGLFFIAIVNINAATELAKADYDTIEVFLLDDTTKAQADDIAKDIEKKQDGIKKVEYRTKAQAIARLKDSWGEQGYLLDNLQENPLPNSLVIYISDLKKSRDIASAAEKYKGVEQVKYYKDTVDKLTRITDFIQFAAVILMIFLVIVSIVIVSNTIKLTVFARSKEISIMKYIGATNWFIRGPFFVEGLILGLLSAIFSSVIVGVVYDRIIAAIGDDILTMLSSTLVPWDYVMFNTVIIFIALGISIGACGSIISMRKFLNV